MEQLGIDPKLILFQLINFGILFFALKKFLYKPVSSFLDARTKTVEDNEKMRQSLEKDRLSLDEKLETLSEKNKKKAHELLKEAKHEAAQMKRNIEKEAKEEAGRILTKAQSTAQVLKERKSAKAQKEMEKVAQEIAKEMLGDILTAKQKQEFTKAAVKRFMTS